MNLNKLATLGSHFLSRGLRRGAPVRILTAVLALSCAGTAQAIVIDDFSTSQAALTVTYPPAGQTAKSSASGAGILGGERDMLISLTGGMIAGNQLSSTVSSGYYSYSQDATIKGRGELWWDGVNGSAILNPSGLGGLDLSVGGIHALLMGVLFDDLPVDVTITVYSDAGNASSSTQTLPGDVYASSEFTFDYSNFSTLLGSGANFAHVGAITLSTGSNTTAPDLVLEYLTTSEPASVPEPGTLSMLGIGIAAVGLCARRRKVGAQR